MTLIEISFRIMWRIGHFRVPKTLLFKRRLRAKPLLWKWGLFAWELKIIFISVVSHLASLWNRSWKQFGNGLYYAYLGGCYLICLCLIILAFADNTLLDLHNSLGHIQPHLIIIIIIRCGWVYYYLDLSLFYIKLLMTGPKENKITIFSVI